MKTAKRLLFLGMLAITGITCKKETIQPNTTGPTVFYFNGTVNGSPVSYSAGVNSYYMYSSYTYQSDSVYSFSGSLHQTSTANNGPNSIQIIINDYKIVSPNQAATIDTSLLAGNYLYLTPTGGITAAYAVTFTPTVGSGTATTYNYDFGDGGTYTGGSGTQTHNYLRATTYTTKLITTFTSGSPDTSQASTQPGGIVWNTSFKVTKNDSTGKKISFLDSIISGGTPSYTIKWNFGDGNVTGALSYPVNDTITHIYPSTGVYKVSATITDVNNNTYVSTLKSFATDSIGKPKPPFISNIAVSSPTQTIIPSSHAFSNITVVYTDASGVTYSSNNITQPTTSNFQITSVSSYQDNQNGQPTKMLHIKFNCQVKDNSSGKTATITNGDAVIAVAYK